MTVSAVAMLLSNRPAKASVSNYAASASHILDDFTFGNNHEDVDAKSGRNSRRISTITTASRNSTTTSDI